MEAAAKHTPGRRKVTTYYAGNFGQWTASVWGVDGSCVAWVGGYPSFRSARRAAIAKATGSAS